MQEINLKYGILLNYTVLEVSEVLHLAETLQVLVRSNIQQEVQPTQTTAQNFVAPPPQVNRNLCHQQVEINRMMQVAQQWSVEGQCQYNQLPVNQMQDSYNTYAGRQRSIRSCITPACHQSQPTEPPGILMILSIRSMATTIAGFSIIVGKSQTEEGIPMPLKFCQTIIMIQLPLC